MKLPSQLTPLPINEWENTLQHIIDDMGKKPLNVHGLMANNPQLLKAWWNFRNHSVKGGSLGERKGELVILRVAVQMKSWYEWASHIDRALNCGITLTEIECVKEDPNSTILENSERLLLKAVDELFTLRTISKETHIQLLEYYSPRGIMDLIAIHGMYVILGGMISLWGLELDIEIENRLPKNITKKKFEQDVIGK
jgi:hypothetical protein